MTDAPRLVCLDTVLVDVLLKIPALPRRGGDVLAGERLVTTGGGFNAMSAAARHGLDVLYAGRLGTGPFADRARASLEAEGIRAPIARHDHLDTGLCVVLVEPDGERAFVTSPGAEATLRREDLDGLGVRAGDFVLVSGYNVMYPGGAETVLGWLANLEDVVILFDPATRLEDVPSANLETMLSTSSWLLANAAEAQTLSGADDARASARALLQRYANLNVLTRDGARGCVVATRDGAVAAVEGFETEVVDTTGAGDVHNGVFVAGLARGAAPAEAARRANAAAAMAISELGPATGPTSAALDAWLDRSGQGASSL